jgi:DNA-binding beta-propeller fold protein YncE
VPITSHTPIPSHRARTLVAAAVAVALTGCGFGESGIAPPTDRFFFPAALAVDPGGDWLYVINSNSDLRYNAGTVTAVDLRLAREDRARPDWGRCPTSSYVPPLSQPPRLCCHDFLDQGVTNCDERGYINPGTTVRLGSFGGTMAVQPLAPDRRRLFVAVRAEPSITFVDISLAGGKLSMKCTDPGQGGADAEQNALCGDGWRVKTGAIQSDGQPMNLQEEPHGLVLDQALGVLYIAHLGGVVNGQRVARGLSVVDVCAPDTRRPRLAAVIEDALPLTGSLGLTSVVPAAPGDPQAPLYGTAEFTSDIVQINYRNPAQARCDASAAADRDLTMVAGVTFGSTAFASRGADLRGLVVAPSGDRAYVLHKEYADRLRAEYNPPSVVEIDRSPDSRGDPQSRPLSVVGVCTGPTELLSHDAGRGPRLYVNCFEGGQVYVVDPVLMVAESIIEVGAGPSDIQFSPSDPTVAYVAGFANNNISILDLRPGSPTEYRVVQRIGFPRSSNTLR